MSEFDEVVRRNLRTRKRTSATMKALETVGSIRVLL